MKRGILIFLIFLSALPSLQALQGEPIFNGHLTTYDAIGVGNFTIQLQLSLSGEPYLMVTNKTQIVWFGKAIFGKQIEFGNFTLIIGKWANERLHVLIYGPDTKVQKVQRAEKFRVRYQPLVVEATPRTTLKLPIEIENPTMDNLTLTFDLVDVPNTWKAHFETSERAYSLKQLLLGPEKNIRLYLIVDIPANARTDKVRFRINSFVGEIKIEFPDKEHKENTTITIPYSQLRVSCDERAEFPIIVENYGEETFAIFRVLEKPQNWNVDFYDSENQKTRVLFLKPNEKKVVYLVAEKPYTGPNEGKIKVLINGNRYQFNVSFLGECRTQHISVKIRVFNEDLVPIKYPIVKFGNLTKIGDSEGRVEFELNPGTYTMTLAAKGYRNKTINLSLSLAENRELDVILEKEPSKVELSFETLDVELNEEYTTVKFILKNLGYEEREIMFDLSGPENIRWWVLKSPTSEKALSILKLGPNEISVLYLKLKAKDMHSGTYNLTFRVLTTENITEKVLRLHVLENPKIKIILDSYYYETQDKITIPVKVRNAGNTKLENLSLVAEVPEGWSYEVSQSNFALEPGETQEIEIKIKTDRREGEYSVQVCVLNEVKETCDFVIIRVTKPDSLIYAFSWIISVIGVILIGNLRKRQ
ncbi:COG1470 family protein [Thermococcus barophilus]|uniref:Alpha-galactosidase NEW3 domain-containing protein n=1 Tax=Thermococcus barophilus (strain DSM 11836 / MP) TaxID=391623 RepID=F0LN82_THEBM|nr:NEW3 domain-containing protein [Thermococcus barophilus]ADT85221.1 hypothetical protein TERMP_02248 [Thermococcus barophilus MP]